MKTKEELFAEIEFESRKRKNKTMKDFTLTVSGRGKVYMYFRNGTHKNFEGGFRFGIYKNRIIFDKTNVNGLVIKEKEVKSGVIGVAAYITVTDAEKYKPWVGDYDLKWDEFYEFWYIEKKEG